jgi:hypothetical protein
LLDSVTWFVEASIFGYPDAGGSELPAAVRQRAISNVFESAAATAFARHGFAAGRVTDNCVWQLSSPETLVTPDNTPIPGEIDILAVNERPHKVFVGECKVLNTPHSPAEMRSLRAKLGRADDSSFYGKLQRKLDWVRRCTRFRGWPEEAFEGFFWSDRLNPIMHQGQFPVINIDVLEEGLKSLGV